MATRTEYIKVGLNKMEKEKLEKYAYSIGINVPELIRDYIKALPDISR